MVSDLVLIQFFFFWFPIQSLARHPKHPKRKIKKFGSENMLFSIPENLIGRFRLRTLFAKESSLKAPDSLGSPSTLNRIYPILDQFEVVQTSSRTVEANS